MTVRNQLIGTTCLVVVLASDLALSAASRSGGTQAQDLSLGSQTLCQNYSGLPTGWPDTISAGMVHIAPGAFVFGSALGYLDERPASREKIQVQSFWIDQSEVTNAQFAAFVRATGYISDAERQGGGAVFHEPSGDEMVQRDVAWWTYSKGASWGHPQGPGSTITDKANQPVTLVTQADALAYAKWLGRDLPTEAEWEYAAKGGRQDDDLDGAPHDDEGKPAANFWQGPFPTHNTAEDGYHGLAPVGCYNANDFRLFDTVGNAWEWTKDIYTGPHQPHTNGETAEIMPAYRKPNIRMVIKGGSFLCSRDYCARYRASSREQQEADLPTSHIGFRTVLREE